MPRMTIRNRTLSRGRRPLSGLMTCTQPRQAILYVPGHGTPGRDAEAQRRHRNAVARCRRKAKALGLEVTQVCGSLDTAFKALEVGLEAGAAQALIMLSKRDLMTGRPKSAIAIAKRVGKRVGKLVQAGVRVHFCEVEDETQPAPASFAWWISQGTSPN